MSYLSAYLVRTYFNSINVRIHFRDLLANDGVESVPPFDKLLQVGLDATDTVLSDPQFKKYLEKPKGQFDVVIPLFFLGHEASYFLAHKFGARLALYCTGQISLSHLNHAMGMDHNTATQPLGLFPYVPFRLTFLQRIVNTVASHLMEYGARYEVQKLFCTD